MCKFKAHKRCAVRATNNCKWTTLASIGTEIIEDEDGVSPRGVPRGTATFPGWWHAGDTLTLSAGGHAPPVAGGQSAGQRALRRLRPRLRQRAEAAGLAVPLVQSHRKEPCPSPPKKTFPWGS